MAFLRGGGVLAQPPAQQTEMGRREGDRDLVVIAAVQVQRLGGGTYEVTMNGGASVAVPAADVIAAR